MRSPLSSIFFGAETHPHFPPPARLLQTQSSSLSASFAPLLLTERTRRATYRTTFSGKLPWEVRGLNASTDEVIPEMSLVVEMKGVEGLPELGRETLQELKSGFEELERELGEENGEGSEENPVRKAVGLLKGLMGDVEELGREVERVSLSAYSSPPLPLLVADGSSNEQILRHNVHPASTPRASLTSKLNSASSKSRTTPSAAISRPSAQLVKKKSLSSRLATRLRSRLSRPLEARSKHSSGTRRSWRKLGGTRSPVRAERSRSFYSRRSEGRRSSGS